MEISCIEPSKNKLEIGQWAQKSSKDMAIWKFCYLNDMLQVFAWVDLFQNENISKIM